MHDGIHLCLNSGYLLHFYFNQLYLSDYRRFLGAIEGIYAECPNILDIIDK